MSRDPVAERHAADPRQQISRIIRGVITGEPEYFHEHEGARYVRWGRIEGKALAIFDEESARIRRELLEAFGCNERAPEICRCGHGPECHRSGGLCEDCMPVGDSIGAYSHCQWFTIPNHPDAELRGRVRSALDRICPREAGREPRMSAERDTYIDRVTRFLAPADDADSRAALTLDGIYSGTSPRIAAMIRTAYRRGVRRGASAAFSARQPISLRGSDLPEEAPSSSCTWTEDSDGTWHTACGEAHVFTTDGPEENRHRFCPYCGKGLEHRNNSGDDAGRLS
jgi:hypothetical protein